MKLYKGIMGAAGVAASLGLFAYASHDAVYEESETGEFPEENPEYAPELPAEKATPYAPNDRQKDDAPETKRRRKAVNSSENYTKGRTAEKPAYRPVSPKLSDLEKALEEEEERIEEALEERPEYDLPPEERNEKTAEELETYFSKALSAKDFRVAESYMTDLELRNSEREYREAVPFIIIFCYRSYLDDVLANCDNYSYDSVFRKIMWMNFYVLGHPEVFPIYHPDTQVTQSTLFNKGNLALEAVEYCSEKKL